MKFETIVIGPLAVNTYLLYDEETRDCIIVDPGDEAHTIIDTIERMQLTPKEIWLTHAHFDHLGALSSVFQKYPVNIYLHSDDYFLYKNAVEQASLFGVDIEIPPSNPTFFNMNIHKRKIGSFTIEIIHTPGHSPGSVSFYNKESNIIFVGDLIFENSIGRTDVPGGSFEALEKSIIEHVYSKGDACVIYPGHGPKTTVGREKKNNPFVKMKG
ncbi:MAG: MBL fold metallo-hydrolase [Proteobacteria bacterium]|nr:MBL fold metallo-hydrolase [Pseudomonadota bacterium]